MTDPAYQAILSHSWYALSGLVITLLLTFARTRTDLLSKLSVTQQWLIGLGVAGGTAFAAAQVGGHPLGYAATATVVALVSAVMGLAPGVGHAVDATKSPSSKPKPPVLPLLMLCVALPIATSGCGLLSKVPGALPDVIAYVQDFESILNAIDSVAQPAFKAAHASDAVVATYGRARRAALLACDAAVNAAHAGEALDGKDVVKAFAAAEAAYKDVVAALAQAGIQVGQGKAGAGPNTVTTETPTPGIVAHHLGSPRS